MDLRVLHLFAASRDTTVFSFIRQCSFPIFPTRFWGFYRGWSRAWMPSYAGNNNFLLSSHSYYCVTAVRIFIIYPVGEDCRQLLHRRFLLLSDSSTFYIGPLFTTAGLHLIRCLAASSILFRDTTVLSLIRQRSFPIFSYKVLGVLPRLVKGLNAILCGKNINFLSVQVFIVHPGGENYLYFRPHHIYTRFFCLARA